MRYDSLAAKTEQSLPSILRVGFYHLRHRAGLSLCDSAKGAFHAYTLLLTFSEVEIKTAHSIYTAFYIHNFIVIFEKSQYFAMCNVLAFFIRQENRMISIYPHILSLTAR